MERTAFALSSRLALGLAFGVVLGCSGSETQDVLLSAGSSGSAGSAGTSGSGTSGNPSTSGDPGTSGIPSTSGNTTSSGNPSGTSGGLPCTPEKEPNDTSATANRVSGKLCGVVGGKDHSDFVTFALPASAKNLKIFFDGNVRLHLTVPGEQPVDLEPNATPKIPVDAGKQYLIEITPVQGSDVSWSINTEIS